MGVLGRILRFILWVVAAVVATWVGRKLLGWLFGSSQRPAPASAPSPGAERRPLFRDPVCGTHVPAEISFTLEDSGQTHHFCSAECRERFAARLGERSRPASA